MLSEKHIYKNVLWGFAKERKLVSDLKSRKGFLDEILFEIDLEGNYSIFKMSKQ